LQELLLTFGPCGREDAVRDVCRREPEPVVDETWVDEAGSLWAWSARLSDAIPR
jgi:putative aminopeptidase FrvX